MKYLEIIQNQSTEALKQMIFNAGKKWIKVTDKQGNVKHDFTAHFEVFPKLMGLVNADQWNPDILEFRVYNRNSIPVPALLMERYIIGLMEKEIVRRQEATDDIQFKDCFI